MSADWAFGLWSARLRPAADMDHEMGLRTNLSFSTYTFSELHVSLFLLNVFTRKSLKFTGFADTLFLGIK